MSTPNIRLSFSALCDLTQQLLRTAKNDFGIAGEVKEIQDPYYGFNPYHPKYGIVTIRQKLQTKSHFLRADTTTVTEIYNELITVKLHCIEGEETNVYSSDENFDDVAIWIANQLTPYGRVVVDIQSPFKAKNPHPRAPEITVKGDRTTSMLETL